MLTAKVDTTVTPITLTVVSDRRIVSGTVSSQGDTATYTATFPVKITDGTGRVWTQVSDDGKTAVFNS